MLGLLVLVSFVGAVDACVVVVVVDLTSARRSPQQQSTILQGSTINRNGPSMGGADVRQPTIPATDTTHNVCGVVL